MSWASLDGSARLVLVLLGLAQLTLMGVALVRWHRTPDGRLALLPRWAWLLIIVFGQLLGPIVFLAAGRRPEPVHTPAPGPDSDVVARAVDTLYGDRPPTRR